MSDDLLEPAKTGRSKCRRCGEPIAKGQIRFGEHVENPFGEGLATHWFHLWCAAEKRPEKLGPVLESYEGQMPDRSAIEVVIRSGIENPKLSTVRRAERATTGRARCQHCREPIAKGSLRIAVEREDEAAMASVSYIHAACAAAWFGRSGLIDKLRRTSPELDSRDMEELAKVVGT